MVGQVRGRLSRVVEVDETYIGGKKTGKRGRGTEGKVLVDIAINDKSEQGIGRIRLWHLEDTSVASLTPFVQRITQLGSTIPPDDWAGYSALADSGFGHAVIPSNELAACASY